MVLPTRRPALCSLPEPESGPFAISVTPRVYHRLLVPVAEHSVIRVPLDSLRPHPRNYRSHPDDQLAHLVRSIELHGQYRNIVVARDHTILAGHGVALAAQRAGLSEVAVVRLDIDPEDVAALQVLAGDNEIPNLAAVDDRMLTELLRELASDDLDNLLSTGFNGEQLSALAFVTRNRDEIADFDEAAEWLGLPAFAGGDPSPQIIIKFLSIEDRDRFLAELLPGHPMIRKQNDAWSTYWPERERNDTKALRFDDLDVAG